MVAPKLPIDETDSLLYEQLRRLPPHQIGEIIGGELVVSPRPAMPHARATSAIGGGLFGPFDRGRGGPGGWWIVDEPELHLGPDVLVPEIAGWRRDRLPEMPRVTAMTLAPDWVLEVLSPGRAGGQDRVRELPRYATAGVKHLWLVDPAAQTLDVFQLQGRFWTLTQCFQGDTLARAEPFDAIELDLSDLWLPE